MSPVLNLNWYLKTLKYSEILPSKNHELLRLIYPKFSRSYLFLPLLPGKFFQLQKHKFLRDMFHSMKKAEKTILFLPTVRIHLKRKRKPRKRRQKKIRSKIVVMTHRILNLQKNKFVAILLTTPVQFISLFRSGKYEAIYIFL